MYRRKSRRRILDEIVPSAGISETGWKPAVKYGLTLYPNSGDFRHIRKNIPSYPAAVEARDTALATGSYYKAWIWEMTS